MLVSAMCPHHYQGHLSARASQATSIKKFSLFIAGKDSSGTHTEFSKQISLPHSFSPVYLGSPSHRAMGMEPFECSAVSCGCPEAGMHLKYFLPPAA